MNTPVYDMIGIGFGPANLAIAIALDEHRPANGRHLQYCFIERQHGFEWHAGMLLSNTHLQVSFMKDLVTLRNPTSRYSFVNYLHQKNRLESFINLGTFYPSRLEYNDYMRWAADGFRDRVHYGETVISTDPVEENGQVDWLVVRSRCPDGSVNERRAHAVVVGIGGQPAIPEPFLECRDQPRICHSSQYKPWLGRFDVDEPRLAVIGSGQSGAEIFRDLMDRHPRGQVDMITRARALNPADDSPFVNEIFDPGFIDEFYRTPEAKRRSIIRDFSHTNYSVVNLDLIEEIYARLYEQGVAGDRRHAFLPCHEVTGVEATPDSISLALHNSGTSRNYGKRYDGVVLATGFARRAHWDLLGSLRPWIASGSVERGYQIPMRANCRARVFLQGCCEETHGLADTLLSVLATRSEEVVTSLYAETVVEQGLRNTG